MPSYINTNIASLNAQRNLNGSQSALQTSLQRLSSGLRINSAKDDAAGMAISSRMTSQINGNEQAARNANDGISLAQTAEGDLAQIGTNLQRMRDLAVQAANATNSASDRAALNNEVQSLAAEIDRVSQNSAFNGVKLLDGTFTAQNFQVGAGATANDQIAINSIASARISALGSSGTTTAATTTGTVTTKALAAGNLTLNGFSVGGSAAGSQPGQSASSATSIASAINTIASSSGVTAVANATALTGVATLAANDIAIAANSFAINGINVGAIAAGSTPAGQGANVAAAINLIAAQTGVSAAADAATGILTLTAADGRNINVTANNSTFNGVAVNYTAANLLLQTGLGGLATASKTDITYGTAAATATTTSMTVNTIVVTGAAGASSLIAAQNFVSAFNAAAALTSNAGTLGGITASNDANGVISMSNNGTQSSMNISATVATGIFVSNYSSQHGTITLNSTNAAGIVQGGGAAASAGFTAAGSTTGATTVSAVNSISGMNISTAASALSALAIIDGALTSVNSSRASLGAYQNRFASVVTSLQTTTENLTASRSRIMDTDFAAETSTLTRNQILQQAGTAMLAQANQLPSGVLALLR